jgi:hypothetical protein
VLLVDGDDVLATPAQLEGSAVTGTVVGTSKGPKINGFTYKRRTNQRRRTATASTTPPSRSPASAGAEGRRDVEDQGRGSTRNGRDSNAQRLGVKVFDGTAITAARSSSASAAPSSTPATTSAAAATTRCSPRRRHGQVRRARGRKVVDESDGPLLAARRDPFGELGPVPAEQRQRLLAGEPVGHARSRR